MRYVSLFSGGGGGDLGCQHLLGWECVGYVEWDKYCCRVLEQRIKDGLLSDAPIFCGDIRQWIKLGYAASYTGLVDVITGGFPCQPFSSAGKGLGADDARNMWPATIDAIRIVRPRFCLLENVAALIAKPYFRTILGNLAQSGYGVRWRRLSAAEVGAPHYRDRIWIRAHAEGERERGLPIRQGRQEQAPTDVGGMGQDVANASRVGWNDQQAPEQEHRAQGAAGRCNSAGVTWWVSEPDVGRVANGVAHRVDRLRAIGNGQVPTVAATAWHLLAEADDL